jgi:oxygen-independent coproporphyrinogen-3 oxidase
VDPAKTIDRARELYHEWDVGSLPSYFQRNSLDYYYLSVWPGLRHLEPVECLNLPPRPGPVSYAYLHIPFCSGVCDFCSYFLTTTNNANADRAVTSYVDQLVQQARIHQRDHDIAVSSVYIGGGTPSVLHPDQLARLLDGLSALGIFAPSRIGTMELHPELFYDPDRLDRTLDVLIKHQIRRVSIGYQTDDDALLDATNRRHHADFLPTAAARLRERGFLFNVDLMYGLRDQTLEAWVDSLGAVLDVRPDSISTYFTFVDYGTKLWRQVQREPRLLATPEQVQLCHIAAQVVLEGAGLDELPNDFYSVPPGGPVAQVTLPSQSNSLALGAGAYGYYPGVQYFNEFSFAGYSRAIAEGRAPLWRAAVFSPDEELRRDVMFSFKNAPSLSLPLFCERHGISPVDAYPGEFEELAGLGLVDMGADTVRLTAKGRLVVEEIACQFDPGRPDGAVASRAEKHLVRKHHYAPTYRPSSTESAGAPASSAPGQER